MEIDTLWKSITDSKFRILYYKKRHWEGTSYSNTPMTPVKWQLNFSLSQINMLREDIMDGQFKFSIRKEALRSDNLLQHHNVSHKNDNHTSI